MTESVSVEFGILESRINGRVVSTTEFDEAIKLEFEALGFPYKDIKMNMGTGYPPEVGQTRLRLEAEARERALKAAEMIPAPEVAAPQSATQQAAEEPSVLDQVNQVFEGQDEATLLLETLPDEDLLALAQANGGAFDKRNARSTLIKFCREHNLKPA